MPKHQTIPLAKIAINIYLRHTEMINSRAPTLPVGALYTLRQASEYDRECEIIFFHPTGSVLY